MTTTETDTDTLTAEPVSLSGDSSTFSTDSVEPKRGRGRPRKLDVVQTGEDGEPIARAARASARPRTTRADKVDALRPKVAETFAAVGMLATPVVPVTGTLLVARSAAYADHICALAAEDARVYRVIERMMTASVYANVAIMAGTILLAVAVDRGPISRDSLPARGALGNEIEHVEAMEAQIAAQAQLAGQSQNGASAPA